jgi:vancomycin permeability regulator SanA
MNRKQIILIFLALLLITRLVFVLVANRLIIQAAEGKLYSNADAIPYNKTGLLLGTENSLPTAGSTSIISTVLMPPCP